MAKGDDSVLRKKNKAIRKRTRSSDSVSARVASIIASKRRRKSGKRRSCEGMCFSLPTPEDPFNDRFNQKPPANSIKTKAKPGGKDPKKHTGIPENGKAEKTKLAPPQDEQRVEHDVVVSKFLLLCLNTIQEKWASSSDEHILKDSIVASKWGVGFWRLFSTGANVADTKVSCSLQKGEKIAWIVSVASDAMARMEKKGTNVSLPFLLYLVPSQDKAVQVREACKPLKALGVHAVSLHPGAALDHQIHGLKRCKPEFLIATPDRLLELISHKAIDISAVSLMILDEVMDFLDMLRPIMEKINSDPQIVFFSNCDGDILNGPFSSTFKRNNVKFL